MNKISSPTTNAARPEASSGLLLSSRPLSPEARSTRHHDIVIVGGGTAGITVAARLTRKWFARPDVAVLEPSSQHFYQPAWTLVGGGAYDRADTRRDEREVIPRGVTWIQDGVTDFHPEENYVLTRQGCKVTYNWLVVAAGIQLNWHLIRGLPETLGKNGVCSNYSFDTVQSTWDCIRKFRGGTAIFTQPAGKIKCGGAPQKICYLAEDYFRRAGVREDSHVVFASAGRSIFSVSKYREALERVVARKGIDTLFRHELVEVRPDRKEAVFRNVETGAELVMRYDMLHVTPPMSAPDFIARSPLADAEGWVEVDKYKLQHVRYPNVFALGDASSLPTSKTAAAIRKQAPVLVKNLNAAREGRPLVNRYDGYTSCPIVTGYGKMMLAEFNYEKEPAETFPFNQAKERWSMWLLKKYGLPLLYWRGMLKGRA